MNDAKKRRKTTEWERLEISSRKLKIPRMVLKIPRMVKIPRKHGTIKERHSKDLTEAEDIKKM